MVMLLPRLPLVHSHNRSMKNLKRDGYVLGESNTYTKTTTTNVGNNILVKGEVVDDFKILNKDYLWTIATSALQEVDRQLQAEKARNDALESRLTALEEKLNVA